MRETGLVQWSELESRIDSARDLKTIVAMQEQLEAMKAIARQVDGSVKTSNKITKYRILLERRAGELYSEMEPERGGDFQSSGRLTNEPTSKQEAQEETGKSRETFSRWVKEYEVDDEVVDSYEKACNDAGQEMTSSGLLRFESDPHVANNSGDNEWYTPQEFVDAARKVMGGIDLDPASSAEANSVVKAKRFFCEKDDGLSKEWTGRVWMNPPYAQPLVRQFCEKLVVHASEEKVTQAVVLVNNATDTEWWHNLATNMTAICFLSGRVKFWKPGEEKGSPLQGQTILYFGKNAKDFVSEFRSFGLVVMVK